MTVSQTMVQLPDGGVRMVRPRAVYKRPKPQPCPECGVTMSVVEEPQRHYACNRDGGCGITRDIHPDTGEMLDYEFDPDYIGDVEFDDWD